MILDLQDLGHHDGSDLDLRDNLGVMQRVADAYGLSLERVQAVYADFVGPRRGRISSLKD